MRDTLVQITKQITRTRHSQEIDYHKIMGAVDEVDTLVSMLSKHIQAPLICMLLLGSVCGSAGLMCALGPQPESPEHLWRKLYVSRFLLVASAVCILAGIWSLALPAAVTAEVQRLEGAINSLRIVRHGDATRIVEREAREQIATILDFMSREVRS